MTWFEAFFMGSVSLLIMIFVIGYFAVMATMLDSEKRSEKIVGGILLSIFILGVSTVISYALGNAQ